MNDYASKDPCKYQSIHDVIDTLNPGWYMAKVDLKWAYRSVGIQESHQALTGLKWTFRGDQQPTYMVDHRLSFGGRKSPAIFNRITQSVCRMLTRRGVPCTAYLDDFLLCGPDFDSCQTALNMLVYTLRQLGFRINWNKVVDPTQRLVFLGIQLDTVRNTMCLDPPKQSEICGLLEHYTMIKHVSRAKLERLAGKLNWAASVIPWGRTQLYPIYQAITKLKHRAHKMKVAHIRYELQWWLSCLRYNSNPRLIWDRRPITQLTTDSSQLAGGAFCQGDWLYCHWSQDYPYVAKTHINIKEMAMITVAMQRWAPMLTGTHVVVYTDSTAAAGMISKGSSSHQIALTLLKQLSLSALEHDYTIEAVHIPGRANEMSDSISRLHEPGVHGTVQRTICTYWPTGILPPISHVMCITTFIIPADTEMVWILKQEQTYMNYDNIKHYTGDYMLYLPNY